MKPILSLGDMTTEPLRDFSSSLSNEAAGEDSMVCVDFMDIMSSIWNLSEKRNPHLTTKSFPSIMYLMPNNSAIVKHNMAMTMQKRTTEKPEYSIGAIGINVSPDMTATNHVSTFDL